MNRYHFIAAAWVIAILPFAAIGFGIGLAACLVGGACSGFERWLRFLRLFAHDVWAALRNNPDRSKF